MMLLTYSTSAAAKKEEKGLI